MDLTAASGAAGNDLYCNGSSRSRAVELDEEDALPCAQHKAALINGDHEVAPNDPGSEMRPRIVV